MKTDEKIATAKVLWLWHGLYHAFVWPKDHERGVVVSSACGHHFTRTSGTKCMGAAHCLDCAEALGMGLTSEQIKPSRGLGYRRESQRQACNQCEIERAPWGETTKD